MRHPIIEYGYRILSWHCALWMVLKGHLSTGTVWNNKFLFLNEPYIDGTPLKYLSNLADGVWIYDARSLEFIEHMTSITACREKYNISRTHFKRVRKFGLPFNGFLFSNTKLH